MLLYSSTSVGTATSGGTPALKWGCQVTPGRVGFDEQGVQWRGGSPQTVILLRPVAPRANRNARSSRCFSARTDKAKHFYQGTSLMISSANSTSRSSAHRTKPSTSAFLDGLQHCGMP
jgi:hypothetical protein